MKTILGLSNAQPEFRGLSEAEVWTALKAEVGLNPVTLEVTRLSAEYFEKFRDYAARHGDIPPFTSLNISMDYPVEKIAMRMMLTFIRRLAEAAPAVTVH